MNRRDFAKLLLGAAVAGIIAGTDAEAKGRRRRKKKKSTRNASSDSPAIEKNNCKGKASCKGTTSCGNPTEKSSNKTSDKDQ
ncbi:MAG: hypothetical protein IPK14_19895 [Blastocatellia bacterium]|nr:hypothetical protein [Blastocatellia bacterium]MBL8193161.1 hypothetical protein [Blastocatellia bacterium]MBN8722298.1 hypothetical protein [Acidobacteriota bacterium]